MTSDPVVLILALAVLAFAGGYLVGVFGTRGKVRRAERRAIREMEALHRARALQDLRDNTSARILP